MQSDLSDVTIIVDRSGSMQSCREEAENGVNHFIGQQREQSGRCIFSLVQFDTHYETVQDAVDIHEAQHYTLQPRGMTALLDAVGMTVNRIGERLSRMPEEDRPGLVAVVIVTDGEENSSHEFTREQVKDMIERQQKDYQWQFTYLGANQDAFHEAHNIGIPQSAAANYDVQHAKAAFVGASANVGRMRLARASGQSVSCGYSPEELQAMQGQSK